MATVAKWRGNRIAEEYLFWNIDDMMKKVGAIK
jgi:hypothetical protein